MNKNECEKRPYSKTMSTNVKTVLCVHFDVEQEKTREKNIKHGM